VLKVQDLIKMIKACEELSDEAKEQITALIDSYREADRFIQKKTDECPHADLSLPGQRRLQAPVL
jgi:hypothetical protein